MRAECVAGIHHTRDPLGELSVIQGIMGGSDERSIVLAHRFDCPRDRLAAGKMTVFTAGPDDRDVGVVIINGGAQRLKFFH